MTTQIQDMDREWLSRDSIRRLLLSLIKVEQDKLIKNGILSPEMALANQSLGRCDSEIDQLRVDEDSLGFDSLSRLDLVLRVNQFFQLHSTGVEDYLLIRRRVIDWVDVVSTHFSLSNGQARIAFQTSGSSGPPKTVTHDFQKLQTEVTGFLSGVLCHVSNGTRVIALVPPHHIYGFLFTCLLPTSAKVETISLYDQTPARCCALAREHDIVIGTPFIWHRLRQSGLEFRSGVTGITSGAPSDANTWSVLENTGLSSLIEVYGATETGGIGFRTAADQPFQLLPHLDRTDEEIHDVESAGNRLDVQDELNWIRHREFEVLGRRDGIVQVAGVNVSPKHVTTMISNIEGVKTAQVRFDGMELHALVVPASQGQQADALGVRIRNHLLQHLEPAMRPSSITFRDALPLNDMGKIQDWT